MKGRNREQEHGYVCSTMAGILRWELDEVGNHKNGELPAFAVLEKTVKSANGKA